jgi:CDP-diacylglycerol--serine O-phosphatidyltransferase
MKLRKLMFVLPNLFTVTSIFCGFYAIALCAGEATPVHLYQAALAILFAMFFDGCDGRVARLTKTQSDFGMQLDSLADVVSFGAAPALLVYKWALAPLGFLGLFISFAFAACGALRLARFNVLAMRNPHGGGGNFFVGLPIPLAAGVLVSMVIAHYTVRGGEPSASAQGPIAAVIVLLSVLMVSTVRYRTFKDARLSKKSALVFMIVAVTGLVIGTQLHPAYVLVAYCAAYLAMGLVESAFLVRRRLAARKVGASAGVVAAAAVLDEEEEDEEEEEESSGSGNGPGFL